jgi:hypothetical protein
MTVFKISADSDRSLRGHHEHRIGNAQIAWNKKLSETNFSGRKTRRSGRKIRKGSVLNCVLQLDTIATSLDIVIRKTIINIKVECKDALNHPNSCTPFIYSLIDDRINIKRVAHHNGIVSTTNEIDFVKHNDMVEIPTSLMCKWMIETSLECCLIDLS